MNLDDAVQLHEEISIIYAVDRYEASLLTADGGWEVARGYGDSVIGALEALSAALSDFNSIEDIRQSEILRQPW